MARHQVKGIKHMAFAVRDAKAALEAYSRFLGVPEDTEIIEYPKSRNRVALFRLYFKALQRVGGALLPGWREIYFGLPRLIEETRWLPELQAALREHGFRDVEVRHLTLYGSAIVSARK